MKKILFSLFVLFSLVLFGCNQNYDELFTEIVNSLEVPLEITQNVDLPTTFEVQGKTATLQWKSSNDAVLSNDGVVVRGEEDAFVDLSVTITIEGVSKTYNLFTVNILKSTKNYTITYDLDGGTCTALVTSFSSGTTIVLPTPTKDGFKFLGWYEEGTKVTKIEEKDYNLVAKWEPKATSTLNVSIDLDTVYVKYEAELIIEGYNDLTEFDIVASNPELVNIDPEGYVMALKAGIVTITCTLKENPEIFGEVTYEIKNQKPSVSLSTQNILVGKTFELNVSNYPSIDVFDIQIDSEFLSYDNGFKALKEGTTSIKLTLKEDPKTFVDLEIVIYSPLPQLSILNNEMMVGSTTRIDVANYPIDDLKFEALTEGIVSFEKNLVSGLKTGEVTVKVSLASDPTIFSTIDLVIVPIKPVLKVSSENILVGGKSRLTIDNLEELEYTNLDDYKVEILISTLIADIDSNWIIEGKSLGTVPIKVTAKNNDYISSVIEVNVIKTSTNRDKNGEIADGPLVLTIENFEGYIHAGDMTYIKIDGAKDLTNYKWITGDDSVLTVYEDGRIICIKEGSAYVVAYNKENKEVTGRIYINVYGEPNVNYVDRLIKIAEGEIGYKEGANNDTKYGIWYGLPNEAWCAMFVSWCAYQAGIGTDVIPKYCGCKAGSEWFISRNQFGYKGSYTPKAGDIIFFLSDGAGHTGLVINCVGGRVYTIEGNTSDMCAKRSYDLNHNTITGYGIPNYPKYDGTVEGGDIGGSTEGGGNSTT